jgi:uncharacterized protein (TIGR02145 family)
MKKIKKTVTVGLLSLCSTVCAAQSLNVFVGSPYTIESVKEASGAMYQWLEDGEAIPGATDASYTNTTGKASAGTYVYVRMAYKDGCGWETSNAITVNVSFTPPGLMVAFSAFSPDPAAPTGTVWYLTDTREGGNNNTYKVKKLADDHIWMVQNLAFGTCPNSTASWYNDNSAAATTHTPTMYEGYVGHCRASSKSGYIYTWSAAMQDENAYAGTGSIDGCTGTSAGTASPNPGTCQGICPTGWHVPTGNTAGEYYALGTAMGPCSSSNDLCWNMDSAFEGAYAGATASGGNENGHTSGTLWSSTAASDDAANIMRFNVTTSTSVGTYSKNYGAMVRCVMNY